MITDVLNVVIFSTFQRFSRQCLRQCQLLCIDLRQWPDPMQLLLHNPLLQHDKWCAGIPILPKNELHCLKINPKMILWNKFNCDIFMIDRSVKVNLNKVSKKKIQTFPTKPHFCFYCAIQRWTRFQNTRTKRKVTKIPEGR